MEQADSSHIRTDYLVTLGLSESDALVFSVLGLHGPCFASTIIRESGKHREIVYRALERLVKRGLVSISQKRGKQYYSVGNLDTLLVEIEQKQAIARQVAKQLARLQIGQHEDLLPFPGDDSYKNGLADFRRQAEVFGEYIVIGGQPESWYEYAQPFFADHVKDLQRLKRNGVDIRILFFQSEYDSAKKYILPYANDPYLVKIVDHSPRLPHTAWLVGSYVYIQTPTQEPLVTRFSSQSLAAEYRHYFDDLWRQGVSVSDPI